MSKFCGGATGVVACLHQQGVEHTLGFRYRRIPAKTGPKTRRGKRVRPLLPHQQNTTENQGIQPMPTRRGARRETNAKRIASFGFTVAKISPKRCGGARVRLEYAFQNRKRTLGCLR